MGGGGAHGGTTYKGYTIPHNKRWHTVAGKGLCAVMWYTRPARPHFPLRIRPIPHSPSIRWLPRPPRLIQGCLDAAAGDSRHSSTGWNAAAGFVFAGGPRVDRETLGTIFYDTCSCADREYHGITRG